MIEAEILTDSVNEAGDRLTTFRLKYPMAIHAQVMTHRVFSRNARSRRAMKPERFADDCDWVPEFYGPAEEGSKMHAGPLAHGRDPSIGRMWNAARSQAVIAADGMLGMGCHRFFANVLTSPFAHTDVVLSSTRWAGFFEQRISDAAEPHFRDLAVMMRDAIAAAVPVLMPSHGWHLPMISADEMSQHRTEVLCYISAGRCARVSYGPSMVREWEEDYKLGLSLFDAGHWSPFEHQARPDLRLFSTCNFEGWSQFRQSIEPRRPREVYEGPTRAYHA
jgi:hypothetical protein